MDRSRQDSPSFDRDEAADVLDLAAALEERDKERQERFDVDDVRRIAAELGISAAAVDEAVRTIRRQERSESKDAKTAVRRRLRFIRHAMAYATVIAILALLDAVAGGDWWFFWFAGLWGILLALHALRFATRRNGPIEKRLSGEPDSG